MIRYLDRVFDDVQRPAHVRRLCAIQRTANIDREVPRSLCHVGVSWSTQAPGTTAWYKPCTAPSENGSNFCASSIPDSPGSDQPCTRHMRFAYHICMIANACIIINYSKVHQKVDAASWSCRQVISRKDYCTTLSHARTWTGIVR